MVKETYKHLIGCNPGRGCFSCPFPDCRNSRGPTKEENELIKVAELAERHKTLASKETRRKTA